MGCDMDWRDMEYLAADVLAVDKDKKILTIKLPDTELCLKG